MSVNDWTVDWLQPLDSVKDAILIVGLPGIGNVGKVAVDFLIDGLDGKQVATFFSFSLPHSVFVTESNLVEQPKIGLWHVPGKKRDLLLLGGDVQPMQEQSCYHFCDMVLRLLRERGCTEVLTFGGVGLREEPHDPGVYCTGTSAEHVKQISEQTKANSKLYGIVGPIIGVSGVLLGLAPRYDMSAATLLVETLGHPMYLGIAGGRKLLTSLSDYLSLDINLEELDKDLNALGEDLKQSGEEMSQAQQKALMSRLRGKLSSDMNYIG